MSRVGEMLAHLAFFEALAQSSEEGAEWHATSAGLVTLRLFDQWAELGAEVVEPEAWGLRAVREAIGRVDPRDATRALLTSVVDSMMLARTPRVSLVAPRLMAYARALQFEARWALAADVYRTVIANALPVDDADVVIAANWHLGGCERVLAHWDAASEAYGMAAQSAAAIGDVMNVLKARISEANLAMARGNLPKAEHILDESIETATEAGLDEQRAVALQDRGVVARQRRDYELAIRCTFEALGCFKQQTARDRALVDLAATFLDIGLLSAARDANLMVAATAQEQYTRWVATINLLEIAALDRREPVFEQYRRELASAELPVTLSAYYFYYVGQGYRMFHKLEQAKRALGRALDVAAAHNLNEVVIKAEQSLREIEEGGVIITAAATAEPSDSVSEVATAIREMRTLAGVAG